MSDRPSIRDVARASGFSPSTVSKALNGHREISDETAMLIRDQAAMLGYNRQEKEEVNPGYGRPTNRVRRIALVRPDWNYTPRRLSASRISELFCEKAAAEGCRIVLPAVRGRGGMLGIPEMEADGALLICEEKLLYRQDISGLLLSGLPVVTVARQAEGCTCLLMDLCGAVSAVLEHLRDLGHRRVAYLCENGCREDRAFQAVVLREAERIGMESPMDCLYRLKDDSPQELELKSRRALAGRHRPTCFLCQDDRTACREVEVLGRMGFLVPEDLSVAGLGSTPECSCMVPPLTTYRMDHGKIAEEALQSLLRQIEDPVRSLPGRILIPGELTAGGSAISCREEYLTGDNTKEDND